MLKNSAAELDVTVIIPTFNRSKLIARTLNSIRNQTCIPAEVIIIDDASSDSTPAAAQRWAEENDFPVTVEALSTNSGPAKARNHGILKARTRYIAFLDSDDEHLPNTLERLIAPLEKIPDAVLSFADATIVTPSSNEVHGLFRPNINLEIDTKPEPLAGLGVHALLNATDTLLKASIIPTSATCFRREAALAAGLMPDRLRSGEDWIFWLRLSKQGRFIFQLDDLALHHRHDENLTQANAAELMAREKLRGFLGLLDGSLGVSLNSEQSDRINQLCKERVKIWRYHLSRLGLKTYLSGLSNDLGKSTGNMTTHLFTDPKSLLRSILRSFPTT